MAVVCSGTSRQNVCYLHRCRAHLLGSVVARTMGDFGDVPAVRLALPPSGRPPRTAVRGNPLKRRQRPSLLRGCSETHVK